MLLPVLAAGFVSGCFWVLFAFCFHRDRSRYRNCYFLSAALLSMIPLILALSGDAFADVAAFMACAALLFLLIVPLFLIYNGIVMIRREGRHASQLLSLALGVMILVGEAAFIHTVLGFYLSDRFPTEAAFYHSASYVIGAVISASVIYVSAAFLVFMVYILFLQVLPRKKDFDFVIIHGAGLLEGKRISKLLADRLDKAIEVYRSDPTPTKLIPSGGQGRDESLPEAEAMRAYLIEKGIPAEDIIPESRSATTLENLQFSKQILDRAGGRRYTALVTSNYHVYRALRYCRKIGLPCIGIGSHVAFYYWPSALIREFIAIHAEKKHAVIFVLGWLLCVAAVFLPALV